MISDFAFLLLYYVFGYRKKVVIANLKLVFPEKSNAEIMKICKAFYKHLADMILEAVKSMTISESEMMKRFKFKNLDIIHNFEKEKRSTMIMCAHYGSWEWLFIIQKYVSCKGFGIYKPLSNIYFDKLIRKIRARYNTTLIPARAAIETITNSVNNGEVSINGFVSDQSPKITKARHWLSFMGKEVPVHTGAEMLAKKLNMGVAFFNVERIKRGYYQATFQCITDEPNKFNDYEITDRFFKLVEKQIYEAPQYYLWTHKRWKHQKN